MNILKQACLVINTADYCQTTSAELEQKMREQVDEAYKEQISFQAEADYFVRYALLFLDIVYLTGLAKRTVQRVFSNLGSPSCLFSDADRS